MSEEQSADVVTRRDDSQPLGDFIASWPSDKKWIEEQIEANCCPRCENQYGEHASCYPLITSCWCGSIGRHVVRPDRRDNTPAATEEADRG